MSSNNNQGNSEENWTEPVKKGALFLGATGLLLSTTIIGGIVGGGIGALGGLAYHFLTKNDYTPYERFLIKHGWMPFGIQRVDVGPEGGSITLQSKSDSRRRFSKGDVIQLEVPKDAVREQGGGKMPIRYGILVNGKFKLKAGYKLVSPVVYVSYDPKDTTKPFELRIPHWSSDEDVFIATSPLVDNEGGDIMFNLKEEMVSSSSRNAAVSSISSNELYAVAVRERAKSNFYAIPLERSLINGRGVELSVIISYASSVWCEILCEHYFPSEKFPCPCPVFKFLDSSIRARLAEDKGPGWDAQLCGYRQIKPSQIEIKSHDINDGDAVKKAVIDGRYPPRFLCKVNWTREAEVFGHQRPVELSIEGGNAELSFPCMTLEVPGIKLRLQNPVQNPQHAILKTKVRRCNGYEGILRNYVVKKSGWNLRALLTNLGVSTPTIDSTLASNIGNWDDAAAKVLYDWAQDNADTEGIWSVLLTAMRNSNMTGAADDLEEELLRDLENKLVREQPRNLVIDNVQYEYAYSST